MFPPFLSTFHYCLYSVVIQTYMSFTYYSMVPYCTSCVSLFKYLLQLNNVLFCIHILIHRNNLVFRHVYIYTVAFCHLSDNILFLYVPNISSHEFIYNQPCFYFLYCISVQLLLLTLCSIHVGALCSPTQIVHVNVLSLAMPINSNCNPML